MKSEDTGYKDFHVKPVKTTKRVSYFCRFRTTDQKAKWVCMANEDMPGWCEANLCPLKNKRGRKSFDR